MQGTMKDLRLKRQGMKGIKMKGGSELETPDPDRLDKLAVAYVICATRYYLAVSLLPSSRILST